MAKMLGCRVEQGLDPNTLASRTQFGLSYLAFDFRRELLSFRGRLKVAKESLPRALQPLDAELSFSDISANGIQIVDVKAEGNKFSVTVTVNCRRPPKFYTALEGEDRTGYSNARFTPDRRRATAVDFAISGVVSVTLLRMASTTAMIVRARRRSHHCDS
jgi:hypothetical protein